MSPRDRRRTRLPGICRTVGALLVFALSGPLLARDLGVQGKAWDITEVDVRRLMVESAAGANWSEAQGDLEHSARRYLDNLPRRSLPVASRTETRWFDPSMTLASDIRVPVRDAKTQRWSWQALYRKGQRFNPLSTHRPLTAMLFFDGRDPAQVDFVRHALTRNPYGLMPVEVSGENPTKLAERLSRPVFYADAALLERFSVTQAPALLYPGKNGQALLLGLTAFAQPFRVEELEQAWALPAAIRKSTVVKGASNATSR